MHAKPAKVKERWTRGDFLAVARQLQAEGHSNHESVRGIDLFRAQNVLTLAKRMTSSAFYSESFKSGGRGFNGMKQAFDLLKLELDSLAAALPNSKAVELPPPPPVFDEARLRAIIREEVTNAIQALLGGEPPPAKTTTEPTVVTTIETDSFRRKIDVIGLLPDQYNILRKKTQHRSYELRYISAEEAIGRRSFAPTVVMCTKFISHSAQDCVKRSGAKIVFADGAVESVIRVLDATH